MSVTEKKKRTPKQTISAETRFVLERLLPVLEKDIDKLDDQELFRLTLEPSEAALGISGCGETIEEKIENTFYGIDPKFHRETIWGIQEMIRHSGDRSQWAYKALKWVVLTVVQWNQDRQLFQFAPKNFHYEKDPIKRAWMIRGWWVFQTAKAFDAQYPGRPSNGASVIGACPSCKKIFKKKQSNAEYCSKYCMNLVFRTTKKK